MILKDIDPIEIGVCINGKIVLTDIRDEDKSIYLTLEQFKKIKEWVANNENNIKELWNDGVAVDEDDDNG